MKDSTLTRRKWLKTAALAGSGTMLLANTNASPNIFQESETDINYIPPIRFAVSTYSFRFFRKEPSIETIIERASEMGFDGVEILHRNMDSEDRAYVNKLKFLAFDAGLALPLLSIHQNFVLPHGLKRIREIEHTKRTIHLAADFGIPCIRINTGSWGTRRNNPNYYQDGIEEPLPGYTDEDAIKWVIDSVAECLPLAEKEGVKLALENHWGLSSNIDYLLRIYDALKESPAMTINADTGNFVGEPYDQFERIIPFANIIQAKTYYGGGLFYDKDLDYTRLGKIARKHGFKGYVSLEFEGKEEPETAVPKSLELLKKGFNGT